MKEQLFIITYEDDWVRGDYPSPKKNEYTNQVSWKKSKWKKDFGYIKNVTILVADQKIQER